MLHYNIKKDDVLVLLSLPLLEYHRLKRDVSQCQWFTFIVGSVRLYLQETGIYQEFSHVAMTQENTRFEALHSNPKLEVIDRFKLENFQIAERVIIWDSN